MIQSQEIYNQSVEHVFWGAKNASCMRVFCLFSTKHILAEKSEKDF